MIQENYPVWRKPRWSKAKKALMTKRRNAPNFYAPLAACADPVVCFPLGEPAYSEAAGKGASSPRAGDAIMAALRDVVKGNR